jgi:hypothetical protein
LAGFSKRLFPSDSSSNTLVQNSDVERGTPLQRRWKWMKNQYFSEEAPRYGAV